jgi:serine phosphatase RsbU (regulator of sigma subunit)
MLPAARYEERTCQLDAGYTIVMISDGVSEAPRPSDDEEFGEERLATLLIRCRFAPAQMIISSVIDAVEKWTEGSPAADDITLVVAKRIVTVSAELTRTPALGIKSYATGLSEYRGLR